jgi:hypothetical protein
MREYVCGVEQYMRVCRRAVGLWWVTWTVCVLFVVQVYAPASQVQQLHESKEIHELQAIGACVHEHRWAGPESFCVCTIES